MFLTASETLSFSDTLAKSGIGIIIVFIGLICLIALVVLMGKIFGLLKGMSERSAGSIAPATPTAAAVPAAPVAPVAEIENRDELIVAFSAAVAEELGTDVSAIRVLSFREIK